jgi:Holliday junction DNA helicase RuvA
MVDQFLLHAGRQEVCLIGYLEGRLLKKEENRILLLVNQIGYEVLMPEMVMETLNTTAVGEDISIYIYHQQTERQPKPVLIGFNLEIEKEFFEYFISVEDIGPLKAVKALNVSIREIARAIEDKDIAKLKELKGVGHRTAQKIVATLEGKMDKFALIRPSTEKRLPDAPDVTEQVLDVLVSQLGYKASNAKRLISEALHRNSKISTPEELFEEVYRGESVS